MEVCDIVEEAVIKTNPKERKGKKAIWLSEEALQIAVHCYYLLVGMDYFFLEAVELLRPSPSHLYDFMAGL